MKKHLPPAWAVSAVLLLTAPAPAHAAPPDAVVRIPSHGGSGVVIWSGTGKTWVLSAAHMFEGRDRAKPLVIDAPTDQPRGQPVPVTMRVLDVDAQLDLDLIEMDTGPLPYVDPPLPLDQRPRRTLFSVGFDSMTIPPHVEDTDLVTETRTNALTARHHPWPGRSGGGLLDGGYLVGIVTGYDNQGRGIYSSHYAVWDFLGRQGGQSVLRQAPALVLPAQPARPYCPT